MNRFNIAYIPRYQSKEFISLSEKFNAKCHDYRLGKGSLPHITIGQFMAYECELDEIWNEVCSKVKKHNLLLSFKNLSVISFDHNLYWVSIIPELKQPLIDTFDIVSKIVRPLRNDTFDPHLTLFNYFLGDLDSTNSFKEQINIDAEFELILGASDDVGQLKNIIFSFNEHFL